MTRSEIARLYFKGVGLEIGPGEVPWPNFSNADIFFMDIVDSGRIPVIKDDANYCLSQSNASYDFVCSSHVFEHLEDAVGAIRSWLRIVKPSGIVAMVVPDKRFTFDKHRALTTIEHLVSEKDESVKRYNKAVHLTDFAQNTEPAQRNIKTIHQNPDPNVHYHVFDETSLLGFLNHISAGLNFSVEHHGRRESEIFSVLKKMGT